MDNISLKGAKVIDEGYRHWVDVTRRAKKRNHTPFKIIKPMAFPGVLSLSPQQTFKKAQGPKRKWSSPDVYAAVRRGFIAKQ